MMAVRLWSVRHSRGLERLYHGLEAFFLRFEPLVRRIGYARLERPVALLERNVKGLLFDCRMCGQCALSSTGMSCPMNCPKTLRNGPCGGIRANGNCEVKPDMPCVWALAWEGSRRMRGGDAIHVVQFAIDHRRKGSSSWLAVMREHGDARERAAAAAAKEPA
jgi:hypothetical protein